MRVAAIAFLVALVALAAPASAHQLPIEHVAISVDGGRADVAFEVAPIDAHAPVDTWLHLALATNAGALPCPPEGPPSTTRDPDGSAVVAWSVLCPQPITSLRADFGAFFADDASREVIVRLAKYGTPDVTAIVVRAGDSPVELHVGARSLAHWVRLGMDHIYDGIDHVSFVLALLLVVMLQRGNREWSIKPFGPSLRATATIVTAFTLAHSCTLIAAALGWFALPSRLVESLIAASIAYTAAENIVRPDVPWRSALAFGFGLAHGLGFASALAVVLPPTGVIPPLLCFNAGVELGQLSIVVVALPIFFWIAQTLGAERYRRLAMPALSSVIFVFGMIWLIQRAFGM